MKKKPYNEWNMKLSHLYIDCPTNVILTLCLIEFERQSRDCFRKTLLFSLTRTVFLSPLEKSRDVGKLLR